MKPVRFLVNAKLISASQNESVLEASARQGALIDFSCEGGTCGACRVFVEEGLEKLPPRNEIESETAEDRGFTKNERLACQMPATEGLVLKTPGFKV